MTIIRVHKKLNNYQYEGRFGSNIPIIKPDIIVRALFNRTSLPMTLHITVRIVGIKDENMLVYEVEENIEISDDGHELTIDDLLYEVKKSVNRTFDKMFDDCIKDGNSFPFERIHPQFDVETVRIQLENSF